jgi:hypothetical protein
LTPLDPASPAALALATRLGPVLADVRAAIAARRAEAARQPA